MAQLEVSHVTKSFDGRKVLEDVSIRLGEKELVALLGVSGGGKTTLFNVNMHCRSHYLEFSLLLRKYAFLL